MQNVKTAGVHSQSGAVSSTRYVPLQQAKSLLAEGHIAGALDDFEKSIAEQPGSEARMGRAVCLLRLGRLLEAEVELAQAVRDEPENGILKKALEYSRRFKPTLKGDRDIEWGWTKRRLTEFGQAGGTGRRMLDFGCGQSAELTRFASQLGFAVTAVDMMPLKAAVPDSVHFIQGEFLEQDFGGQEFDVIVNCSSVEHSGLAGRYGVLENRSDADLQAMKKMRELVEPSGRQLLVIPVGRDVVVGSLHRVYGPQRLPRLLAGWEVESEQFWLKDENDKWQPVDRASALQREGTLAYAIGCFVLRKAGEEFAGREERERSGRISLFDEEPPEVARARRTVRSYYEQRLKDLWGHPDHPVWFDHNIDYHLWPKNLFWVERGVFGRSIMRPGCRVLDLCCGDGYFSDVWYSSIAGTIDACDNDAGALRFARLRHSKPNVNYHFIDVLSDDLPGSNYDVITWFEAIEHFSESHIKLILRKLASVLRADGKLIGSTTLVRPTDPVSNRQHDREFSSAEELQQFLRQVFGSVRTWVSEFSGRRTCYFLVGK